MFLILLLQILANKIFIHFNIHSFIHSSVHANCAQIDKRFYKYQWSVMFANTKILLNNSRILQLRLKTKPSGHHSVDNVVYCDNTTSRDLTLPVSVSEQIKSTWMRRVVSIAWDVIISNLCVDVGLLPLLPLLLLLLLPRLFRRPRYV